MDRRVWPVNIAPLHAAQRKDRITGIYYHKSETREDNISLSSLRYSWFSGKQLNADIDPFRRRFHWIKLRRTFNGHATYPLHLIYFTIVYACANAINIVAGNVHNLVIPQSEHKILLFSTYCKPC